MSTETANVTAVERNEDRRSTTTVRTSLNLVDAPDVQSKYELFGTLRPVQLDVEYLAENDGPLRWVTAVARGALVDGQLEGEPDFLRVTPSDVAADPRLEWIAEVAIAHAPTPQR